MNNTENKIEASAPANASPAMVQRNLKIEERGDFAAKRIIPALRLKGKWLQAAGFRVCCYCPATDEINMANSENFGSSADYYATLFHELTHSTGHASRLNRLDCKRVNFGSGDYSREELVAEMGAAFLCGEAGIFDRTVNNSAAYLQGWLKSLENDRNLIITAAAQAQKAVDYILNRQHALTE